MDHSVLSSTLLVGFGELASTLDRPAPLVRAAYAAGFIPLQSEMRGGARCFDRAEAELLAAVLAIGDGRAAG